MKRFFFFLFIVLITFQTGIAQSSFLKDPDAIEKAAQSVLKLYIYDKKENLIATGSGFVAFDNLTLVTNYHVIENAETILGESDDGYKYYLTHVIAASEENDLAILRFMSPTIYNPLPLSTAELRRGQEIMAIGSPKGLKNIVSTGIISGLSLDIYSIHFTAPISSGSSGGALFNEDGEVIGITSAGVQDGQNLNLAISITKVIDLYENWDGKTYYEINNARKANGVRLSHPENVVSIIRNGALRIEWDKVEDADLYRIYLQKGDAPYFIIKTVSDCHFECAIPKDRKETWRYKLTAVESNNKLAFIDNDIIQSDFSREVVVPPDVSNSLVTEKTGNLHLHQPKNLRVEYKEDECVIIWDNVDKAKEYMVSFHIRNSQQIISERVKTNRITYRKVTFSEDRYVSVVAVNDDDISDASLELLVELDKFIDPSIKYRDLVVGTTGEDVLAARNKLYELGYFKNMPTSTKVTEAMCDYVKKFERDYGLKIDGILSAQDQIVLFNAGKTHKSKKLLIK